MNQILTEGFDPDSDTNISTKTGCMNAHYYGKEELETGLKSKL